jgi:hypothetical protein
MMMCKSRKQDQRKKGRQTIDVVVVGGGAPHGRRGEAARLDWDDLRMQDESGVG